MPAGMEEARQFEAAGPILGCFLTRSTRKRGDHTCNDYAVMLIIREVVCRRRETARLCLLMFRNLAFGSSPHV
jgi:hypothetical protein